MLNFLHIKSVTQVHELFGLDKPLHPLITIIRKWPESNIDFFSVKLTSDLYLLSMKGKINSNSFNYGRNTYDFAEGSLVFLAPNQVISFEEPLEELDDSGWTIIFHPDLIRKSQLGKTIKDYSFFDYGLNESLHLSEKEKQTLISLVENIDTEIKQNTDKHTQELVIATLETIFKYCLRFYDRQFYSRTNINKDIVSKFESFLDLYFNSNELAERGIPSLTLCGEALNLSGPYLSDLLRIETGKSAKEHIYYYITEKAKYSLLNSNATISEIAYNLGFEHPQHFSKLFKLKTGNTPSEYRNFN